MRVPQPFTQPFSVRSLHFLTDTLAIFLVASLAIAARASTNQLRCSPTSLRFGGVAIGQTETLLVTLSNNGQTSVTVSAITTNNPEFSASGVSLPMELSPGQSADLNVNFTPTSTGWAGGSIEFTSDASNGTLTLGVGGAGRNSNPVASLPATLSFGNVAVGSDSTLPIVLTNMLKWDAVTFTNIIVNGSGFTMSGPPMPLTLDAGQSITVNVTFAPQSTGLFAGSVYVVGPALSIPFNGTGTAVTQPSVSLSWDASTDVAGYNVYRSNSSNGTYTRINPTLDANAAYTDNTVVSGQTYYYAATSVNSSGQESALSSPPVQAVIP